MTRHPVITGIGVVAPTGIGTTEAWKALVNRTSGISPIDALPVRLGGQVSDFDASAFVPSRVLVQTDRWTHFAMAATRLALADAELEPERQYPFGLAVVTASAQGGNAFGQKEIQALWAEGPRQVSAYQSIGWFYAASSGQISIRHQLKGACGVLVADTAGGIDALAQSCRLIRRATGAVVVGGTEAPLSPYALACQRGQAELSVSADPQTAYRPYAPDPAGFVPGEGGAMLLVEGPDHARRRGAPNRYAEIAGTASTHDAYHVTDPAPDCRQLARVMSEALRRAGRTPDDVDAVFGDGAGDVGRDRLEVAAIRTVFGERRVPVSMPKTMTGRLYSGGAALDLAWAALALHHDVIPPSVNLDAVADGHQLDLVTEPREGTGLRTVLVVARGAGGFNSAAVLRTPRA